MLLVESSAEDGAVLYAVRWLFDINVNIVVQRLILQTDSLTSFTGSVFDAKYTSDQKLLYVMNTKT